MIGGSPGAGKSVVRKHLAVEAARRGCRVQEYVLEDPEDLTVDRVFADAMDVGANSLARGKVPQAAERMAAFIGEADWARNIVLDCEGKSPSQLAEAVQDRWVDSDGSKTDLVLVDYVQLMDSDPDEKSVERIVAKMAGWGLDLAKRTGAGVVIFSQVTKQVEERGRKLFDSARWNAERTGGRLGVSALQGFRAGLSDLQWSSALGQRAKTVVTLFREGYWGQQMGLAGVKDDTLDWQVCKNNFGPQANLRFRFDGDKARISDAG